jgi:hypothetical protein
VQRQTAGLRERESGKRAPERAHASAPPMPTMQRANCACGGGCPRCRENYPLQAKLEVSQPGDALEKEADRVAEQVLRMPQPEHPDDPEAPESTGLLLSRYAASSAENSPEVPSIVHDVVRSPGEPLDPATRAFMEPRFGHDFSSVRVHSGAAAEQSARGVNAKAYAVGHDIVFGANRFAPGTLEGRRLIAHELAHVVQQSGAEGVRVQRQPHTGAAILRLREDGSVEVLLGTPDLPVAGPLGAGFRCHEGQCQFVAGRDPVGGGRTYSIDEAKELLQGIGRGDAGTVLPGLGLGSPNIGLPLCPPGQIPLGGGCRPIGTTTTPAEPGLTLEAPTFAYTGIQSHVIDRFTFNGAALPDAAAVTLDSIALRLIINDVPIAWIEGHADERGDPGHNKDLSLRRAQAIRHALVDRHVPADRLVVRGLGASQPLIPGATSPADHERNRRVEISWVRQSQPRRPSLISPLSVPP